MTRDELDAKVEGLATKSSKIRCLADHGVSRSEIADYLGISYQHVRNVVTAPRPAAKRVASTTVRLPSGLEQSVRPISIEEAKLGLAAHFGVPPTAIEITIRG